MKSRQNKFPRRTETTIASASIAGQSPAFCEYPKLLKMSAEIRSFFCTIHCALGIYILAEHSKFTDILFRIFLFFNFQKRETKPYYKVHTKQPRIKYETASIFLHKFDVKNACKNQSEMSFSILIGSYLLNVLIFEVKFQKKTEKVSYLILGCLV